ncbi:MAG: preprotein translocase subunit SecE [Candidatus Omnitrophica bacterium]|nr:preprotein translocase subunit SecE [Candidatus Omnitrophota bacterium]
MIRKTAAFLRDVRNELGQVSWASPQELLESAKVVVVTMVLLSAIIALFDWVCAGLMSWIMR